MDEMCLHALNLSRAEWRKVEAWAERLEQGELHQPLLQSVNDAGHPALYLAVLHEWIHIQVARRTRAKKPIAVQEQLAGYPDVNAWCENCVADWYLKEFDQRLMEYPATQISEFCKEFVSDRWRNALMRAFRIRHLPWLTDDRYEILHRIDKGGQGEVFLVWDCQLERQVALKTILPRFADFDDFQRRLHREAKLAGKLEHPAILPIYDLLEVDGRIAAYTTRFFPGESLAEAIKAFHGQRTALDLQEPERVERFRQLVRAIVSAAEATAFAHGESIFHRDIKPQNILLQELGAAVLVDWGIAYADESPDLPETVAIGTVSDELASTVELHTVHGTILGTPAYMHRDQALGSPRLGAKGDIYTLGATLYHLLAGVAPHSSMKETLLRRDSTTIMPPSYHKTGIPRALEAIALRAMELQLVSGQVRPAAAYGSAGEMIHDLQLWLADDLPVAYRDQATPGEKLAAWAKRNKNQAQTLLAVGGVALILLTAGLFVFAGLNRSLETKTGQLTKSEGNLKTALANESKQKTEAARLATLAEAARRDSQKQLARNFEQSGLSHVSGNQLLRAIPQLTASLAIHNKLTPPDPELLNLQKLRLAALLAAAPRLVNVRHFPDDQRSLSVRFHPDGEQILAFGDGDGFAWNLETNSLEKLPQDFPFFGRDQSAAHEMFSASARLLLGSTELDGNLELYCLECGEVHSTIPTNGCEFAVFSRQGTHLAGLSSDTNIEKDEVWLWDIGRGEGHALEFVRDVDSIQFSDNGERLLVVAGGGLFGEPITRRNERPKDLADFAAVCELASGKVAHFDGGRAAAISPSGQFLAIGHFSGGVDIIHVDSRATVLTLPAAHGTVKHLAFSADGNWLLQSHESVGSTGMFEAWRLTPGDPAIRPGERYDAEIETKLPIKHFRFSPDGCLLMLICESFRGQEEAQVYAWPRAELIIPPLPVKASITSADFCPDSRRIVVASDDGLVRVWDLASQLNSAPLAPEKVNLSALGDPPGIEKAESNLEDRVVILEDGQAADRLVVFDRPTKRKLAQLSHQGFERAWFSPSGRYLVTEYMVKFREAFVRESRIYDLSVPQNELIGTFRGVSDIEISLLEDRVTMSGEEGAKYFDLAERPKLATPVDLSLGDGWNQSKLDVPTDRLAIWAHVFDAPPAKVEMQVWQLPAGIALTPPFAVGANEVTPVFSPTGQLAIYEGNRATIWRLQPLQHVPNEIRHFEEIKTLSFSPDGARLLSTTTREFCIWDAWTGEQLSPRMPRQENGYEVRWDSAGRLVVDLASQEEVLSPFSGDLIIPSFSGVAGLRWRGWKFTTAGQVVAGASIKSASTVELALDEINEADLRTYSAILTGESLDGSGNVVAMTPAAIESAGQEWRRTRRTAASEEAGNSKAWHERRWQRKAADGTMSFGADHILPHLRELARLEPNNGERFAELAYRQCVLRHFRSAAENLQQALELGVDDLNARTWLTRALLEQSRWEEAEKSLAQLPEDSVDTFFLYQFSLVGQQKWRELADSERKQPKAEPAGPWNYFYLGTAHAELGNFSRAQQYFEKAADLAPQEREFTIALARAALAAGDMKTYESSVEHMLNSYKDYPKNYLYVLSPDELFMVAWVGSMKENKHSKSALLLRVAQMSAEQLFKTRADVLHALAAVHLRSGELKRASELLSIEASNATSTDKAYSALLNAVLAKMQGNEVDKIAARAEAKELMDKELDKAAEPPAPWFRRDYMKRLYVESAD